MGELMKVLFPLLFLLVSETEAYGGKKKKPFMPHIPGLIKFLMFWWCVIVSVVLVMYILDRLMLRLKGPAFVEWTIDHVFEKAGKREDYWAQFVNPTKWAPTHPILQSAELRMVQMVQDAVKDSEQDKKGKKDNKEKKGVDDKTSKNGEEESEELHPGLKPVPFKLLEVGYGFILRHKEGSGMHEKKHFCTRECTEMSTPKDGAWRFSMRTVEVGPAHFFIAGTEETELDMLPKDDDGNIWCQMRGKAGCESRFQRWWMGLRRNSMLGAEGMMEAIAEEVTRKGKKKD